LISYPDLRKVITAEFVRIAKGIDIDVIAGGETAGIAYAAFLADKLKKPMIYVRKQPKGHGKASQVEGVLRKGERVLLVEDLVTDGKSKLIFKEGIEACGGVMEHCLCIFEYYSKQAGLHLAKERLAERGVKLHSLITWDDILRVGLAKGYITEEECDHILRFLKDF
jgi:orotate phosphoribosyltransferase